MVETRVQKLEELVGDLRAQVAEQSAHIEHLIAGFDDLKRSLAPIAVAVNKGRGALSALMLVSGLIGSAFTFAIKALFDR